VQRACTRGPPVTLLVAAVTILMTVQPFVVTATQNDQKTYDYHILVAAAATELLKLLLSIAAYVGFVPSDEHTHTLLGWRDALKFAIPAVVYTLNNALVYLIVQYLKPSAFQLLSATKTVFTAILMRFILQKMLNSVQKYAIVLLAAGAAVSQLSQMHAPHPYPNSCGSGEFASGELGSGPADTRTLSGGLQLVGVLLTLVSCAASSLGGVTNELLLKRDGALHSLHLQNGVLYAWGVLFNIMAMLVRTDLSGGVFQGFDGRVVGLIILNATTGLTIAAILKFTDNIVRVIAHIGAMLASAAIESTLGLATPELELCIAIVIVGCSTLLYAGEVNRGGTVARGTGVSRMLEMVHVK
jgi:drug/metabolite transporter (DMT)-like permease